MVDRDYNMLLKYIKEHIAFDGTLYKERPFKRRLSLRMKYTDQESYYDYLNYLRHNPEELEKLKDSLTINVTRFLRNRTVFDFLKKYIREQIKQGRKNNFNILSVGCSSGEEPYSMAMIMHSLQRKYNIDYYILGLDYDTNMLAKAKTGVYNQFSLKELSEAELHRNFSKLKDKYVIRDEIKEHVMFKEFNVKNTDSLAQFGMFDIILCRNVLIYFSREFQYRIILAFNEILNDNGILVLGKIEIIMGKYKDLFSIIDKRERIYKKIGNQDQNS